MIRAAITKRLLSSRPDRPILSSSSSWFLNRNHQINNNVNDNDVIRGRPSTSSSSSLAASYHVSSGDYMRGAVFWDVNKPLSIEEFHLPRPKAGEVLIKTKGIFSFPLTSQFKFCFS